MDSFRLPPTSNFSLQEMTIELLLPLIANIFIIAALYSSVGHAGASGYIAVTPLLSLTRAYRLMNAIR